jgi:hypothetical protein
MRTIFNQQTTQEVTPNGEGFTALPVSFNASTAGFDTPFAMAQGATQGYSTLRSARKQIMR